MPRWRVVGVDAPRLTPRTPPSVAVSPQYTAHRGVAGPVPPFGDPAIERALDEFRERRGILPQSAWDLSMARLAVLCRKGD